RERSRVKRQHSLVRARRKTPHRAIPSLENAGGDTGQMAIRLFTCQRSTLKARHRKMPGFFSRAHESLVTLFLALPL
ncbi:MAG TPA: hypothetical protein VER17_16235, partial [Tepidisphaeraceae bacterium]|nr:hypothetical protein [Tepidisphaeraceae bacterium]